jgi:outer membrane protein OmpA-like peptidoglycan-associated protein
MNAINITIGGLIASIFFIFLCISLNAENYYKELNPQDNINAVSVKPNIVLRDRSTNNITIESKDIPPVLSEVYEPKPIVLKEENSSMPTKTNSYLLSDNNVSEEDVNLSENNISFSPSISSSTSALAVEVKASELNNTLETIQDKISSLLEEKKIRFKKNSGKLSREGQEVLDELIALLSNQKNFRIEVQGHTDAGGKRKVNQWISQTRANRVKKYLVRKGLSSKKIKAKGFGETRLLFVNKPYSQKNRRVEIYIKRIENNASIND